MSMWQRISARSFPRRDGRDNISLKIFPLPGKTITLRFRQNMNKEAVQIENFTPAFDCAMIAEKSGGSVERVFELVEEARGVSRGAGAALVLPLDLRADGSILLGDVEFKSPLLKERFSGLGRAFPYIVTEGREMAEWGARYKNTQDACIIHQIRQAAVKCCEQQIEKMLCDRFGMAVISSLNPGSLKDWPISEQARLFEVLGSIPAALAISLLPSGIMQPDYSVSGIFYQTDKKYYNCQLCPRDGCPNRKAPRNL